MSTSVSLFDWQQAHAERIAHRLLQWHTVVDTSSTGLGKTYIALHVWQRLGQRTLFVLCPRAVRAVWEELLGGLDPHGAGERWKVAHYEEVLKGVNKGLFRRVRSNSSPRQSEPINDWLARVPGARSIAEWEWIGFPADYVIVDEVHNCGGVNTLRAELLLLLYDYVRGRDGFLHMLSATPADTPLRMFALGYVAGLHNGWSSRGLRLPWPNWLTSAGCRKISYTKGGGWVLTNKAAWLRVVEDLREKQFFLGLTYSDLPSGAVVNVRALLPLPAPEFADGGAELLTFEELYAQRAEHALQPAFFHDLRQRLEIAKVDAIVEHYTSTFGDGQGGYTHKVAVFLHYRNSLLHAVHKFADVFGAERVALISGQVPHEERARAIAAFQAPEMGEKDVCAVIIQTDIAEGFSLHDARKQTPRTAYVCPGYRAVSFVQSLGRLARVGGGPAIQYVPFIKGSMEMQIVNKLRHKLNALERITDEDLLFVDERPASQDERPAPSDKE